MTKRVLISVKGTQFSQGTDDVEPLEVITGGTYYKKNGKHYVLYEEIMEGIEEPIKNTLKFDETLLILSRSGAINAALIFEKDHRCVGNYNTPFGSLSIGTTSNSFEVTEEDDEIKVKIDYSMDINSEYLSDCSIIIKINSTGK